MRHSVSSVLPEVKNKRNKKKKKYILIMLLLLPSVLIQKGINKAARHIKRYILSKNKDRKTTLGAVCGGVLKPGSVAKGRGWVKSNGKWRILFFNWAIIMCSILVSRDVFLHLY